MQKMIDNLINGNLTDAKKQAKRVKQGDIILYAFSTGYSRKHACAIAGYLKGQISFDDYCKITEKLS